MIVKQKNIEVTLKDFYPWGLERRITEALLKGAKNSTENTILKDEKGNTLYDSKGSPRTASISRTEYSPESLSNSAVLKLTGMIEKIIKDGQELSVSLDIMESNFSKNFVEKIVEAIDKIAEEGEEDNKKKSNK